MPERYGRKYIVKTVKQTIIFDFDGTIADTFATSIYIFEQMTKRQRSYSTEEIEHLRGMTGLQLIRELRIRPWLVPFMLARGRTMMRRKLKDIDMFPGIDKLIKDLHAEGVPLYIISSNSTTNIRRFLKERGLDDCFIRIYGNIGLFGKSNMLRRVMKQNRLDPKTVTYVGDEARDIEAAQRVGIRIVSVTWGFNNTEVLSRHEPDVMADTTAKLAKALKAKR